MKIWKLWIHSISYKTVDKLLLGLLGVCMLSVLMLSLSFGNGIFRFMDLQEEQNIHLRRILIYGASAAPRGIEQIKDKISENFAYEGEKTFLKAAAGDQELNARLYGITKEEELPILYGRRIDFQKRDEILIPNENYFVDGARCSGSALLGKTISAKYDILDFTPAFQEDKVPAVMEQREILLHVVGVYDGKGFVPEGKKGAGNVFYAPFEMVLAINKAHENNLELFEQKEQGHLLTVKKGEDAEAVLAVLQKAGLDAMKLSQVSYVNLALVSGVFGVITAITLLGCAFILGILQRSFVKRRLKTIGLLRAMGYEYRQIFRITLLSNAAVFGASFLIAWVFSWIGAQKIGLALFWNTKVGSLNIFIAAGSMAITLFIIMLVTYRSLKGAYRHETAWMLREVD